ncbi:hypothetical protein TB2_007172 [Malus domestica]
MHKCSFTRIPSETTLYIKTKGESESIIVSIYVDDIIYTGSSLELINEFKANMMKQDEVTYLGLLSEIVQSEHGIFINQRKYAWTFFGKFGLKDCKPVSTPLAVNEKLKNDDGSDLVDEALYSKA